MAPPLLPCKVAGKSLLASLVSRWLPPPFHAYGPLMHTSSLWELKRGSKTARPMLKKSISKTWIVAVTGRRTVPLTSSSNRLDQQLWELKGSGRGLSLTQLTNGPLSLFLANRRALRTPHLFLRRGPARWRTKILKQTTWLPTGGHLPGRWQSH